MDKIKKKWPDNMKLRDKVNELVEGYNKIMKLLEHYNLDRIDDDRKEKNG